ncbi:MULTISPECIES: conjugative transfer system coupling protein TraD [unclassified Pseudoalteromonas]|uniref:conjugative transfer system coupling protein TraD n=1 Tax=unclassified Pseudoalteromonas TaxID=194690 RepID=UPI00040F9DAA|nr:MULTISPECIES: conjugative transfer system coupling protein TraD [unclassified Pseudoalteromonas]
MAVDRGKHFWMENLFRPIFELRVAQIWFCGGLFTIIAGGYAFETSIPAHLIIGVTMILVSLLRLKSGYPLLKRQFRIFVNYFYVVPLSKFRKDNIKNKERAFLGKGFEWGPEHAQRAYQVMSMSTEFKEVKIPFVLKPFTKKYEETTRKLGGRPWIHGLGDEKEVDANESVFHAHSVIFGNPGTGKTTLLKMLSGGALHRGNVIIIIDPKNDSAWRQGIEAETKALGMEDRFYFFHPSHPSKSCRIDPMSSYVRTTELASRIASLLPGESESDPFVQFAWKCIYQIIEAMHYVDEKPQLTSIGYYLMSGKRQLAERCFDRLFVNVLGEDWVKTMGAQIEKLGQGDLLAGMVAYYSQTLMKEHANPALDGMVSMVTHDSQHMSKMLSTTAPLFAQLTSKPLDELLSPKVTMGEDDELRPIVDIDKLVRTGGVLYVALDSLSDSMVASAIGKLVLADVCAASARRYNYEEGLGRRVSLFVDEAHACINEPLINMMAVARGAQFELYVSSQTLPDYIAKTSEAQARRILGLASNLFCLRVNDNVTQEYATENFGEANIRSLGFSLNSGTSTAGDLSDFSGGLKEQLTETREKIFPATMLGDLPNLQYIARLADGRKIKGRIPFLTEPKEAA